MSAIKKPHKTQHYSIAGYLGRDNKKKNEVAGSVSAQINNVIRRGMCLLVHSFPIIAKEIIFLDKI
jgi:hypothetical protein